MSEIYNNFNPKKAAHIDQRLVSVDTYGDLLDGTDPSNFLYEGALVYVKNEETYYKLDATNTWVKSQTSDLEAGVINITTATTVLDLSLVTPNIDNCYSVLINISGGISATIQSITNFPAGENRKIEFYVESGKTVTFKHFDYDVASTDQIVIENGFDFTLTGRLIGNEALTLQKQDTAIVQYSAVQFMKAADWLTNLVQVSVENNLTSTDATKALAATQGPVLKNLIDGKQAAFTDGDRLSFNGSALNVLPADWVKLDYPINGFNMMDNFVIYQYLTNNATPGNISTTDYRYISMINSSGNGGMYLLPPGADPTVGGNWITLKDKVIKTGSVKYNIVGILDFTTATLVSGGWPILIKNSPVTGDSSLIDYTHQGTGNFNNFVLQETGLYMIDINLKLGSNNGQVPLDNISRLRLELMTTDGGQSLANPINGGSVVTYAQMPYVDFAALGGVNEPAHTSIYLRALINVDSVGIDDGITFYLKPNTSSIDWTDIYIVGFTSNMITVTKIN